MNLPNLLILLLFIVSLSKKINAQERDSLLKDTNISLITCAPGDDLASLFGHSALRVVNKKLGYDMVYNYGTFDFRTPGFMVKFMRGKLPYKLVAYGFADFLVSYNNEKRGVREQVLNINNEEKKKIIAFVENNAKPENALYKYDFFYDNCSTRIRDLLQKNLGYSDTYHSNVSRVTFRDMLHLYLEGSQWTKLGIDMVIGSSADKNADAFDQMFLPDFLHDILGKQKLNNSKVLFESKVMLDFENERELRKIPSWPTPFKISLILLAIIGISYFLKKEKIINIISKAWFITAILSSIIILLLWFATDHQATRYNWNLLWLNPLYLLLFFKSFPYKKQVLWTLLGITIFCMLNHFINIIPQDMPTWQLPFIILVLIWGLYKSDRSSSNLDALAI